MIIKDTNNPNTLKKYIRYVVSKYHELGDKYVILQDKNLDLHSKNTCLTLEKLELEKEKKSYIREIKNLYGVLGEIQGFDKNLDFMGDSVIELNDRETSSQLSLFDEFDEATPLIEFNEVTLDCDECVDKFIPKIQ
jgi:hypothetical protein